MRFKIRFHSFLKKLVPEEIIIEAENIRSAIEGATRQLPQLAPNASRGRLQVSVVGCPTYEDLLKADREVIDIVPQLSGGKEGGFIQILVGVVTIAAAFIPGVGPLVSAALLSSGIGLVVGGLLSFLLPTPNRDTASGDPEASKYLGSPRNTTQIATRIPVLYGRDRVYGHFLSFDIDSKDIAV